MKSFIKKQTYYSMLLMRDDSEVRSFRVKNTTLRTCIILFVLLTLTGFGGIAAGVHYWKRYADLSSRTTPLERDLIEAKLKVEQLTNESTLWRNAKSTTPPASRNEELSAAAPQSSTEKGAATVPANILAPLHTQGANATMMTNAASFGNATLPGNAAIPGATKVPGLDANTETPHPATNATVGAAIAAASAAAQDAAPIRLSGFNAKSAGSQRIRIRYSIISPEQQQVGGTVTYKAHTSNGTQFDLIPQAADNARFNISRMKNVEAYVKLPTDMTLRDLEAITILIDMDNGQHIQEKFASR